MDKNWINIKDEIPKLKINTGIGLIFVYRTYAGTILTTAMGTCSRLDKNRYVWFQYGNTSFPEFIQDETIFDKRPEGEQTGKGITFYIPSKLITHWMLLPKPPKV